MKKTITILGTSAASFLVAGFIAFGAAGAANAEVTGVDSEAIVQVSGAAGIIAD